MSYQVPDFDGPGFSFAISKNNLIPQRWHLGHSLPDKQVNFGDFLGSRCQISSSAPPSPDEAGAGHHLACAMVTLHSWTHSNSWAPQEQYTPTAAVAAPAALSLDLELLKTIGKE